MKLWRNYMIDYNNLPACPVQTCLNFISDKWKILIIRDLLTGTKRFGELRKSLNGISQKVLTNNLRDMENLVWSTAKLLLKYHQELSIRLRKLDGV